MLARFIVALNDTEYESSSMVDIHNHLTTLLSTLEVSNADILASAMILSVWHGKCDTLTLTINDEMVKVGRL